MYETGTISNDYKFNKTVTVPKKVGADKCETYRTTMCLTTHASKIPTTTIYRRIKQAIRNSFDEDQFHLKEEKRTREALLSLGLIQNSRL